MRTEEGEGQQAQALALAKTDAVDTFLFKYTLFFLDPEIFGGNFCSGFFVGALSGALLYINPRAMNIPVRRKQSKQIAKTTSLCLI